MLDILYNMSADAYAKLVAHNNTVVQQFKTYKEAQERTLAEAYARLAALKEFCAKEREEMREAFEQEKQALILERDRQSVLVLEKDRALERQALAFEREKQSMRDAFERERQSALALERQSALALERQSALALETPSTQEQVMSDIVAGFFKANQNDTC
jgi:hypothetical protein